MLIYYINGEIKLTKKILCTSQFDRVVYHLMNKRIAQKWHFCKWFEFY